MRPRLMVALAAAAAVLTVSGGAGAFVDDLGTRGVAMGGSGRADARGDQALPMNPSGMSLVRLYSLQARYQGVTQGGGQLFQASVIDSTSAFGLSGGLYYGYRTASLSGFSRASGHEAGVALSAPIGEFLMLGLTGKYLRLRGGPPEPDGKTSHDGFTVDAGLTVRPAPIFTLGVVGYSLRDLSTTRAPLSLGYGAAVTPLPGLTVAADLFHDFTTSNAGRGVTTSLGAGGEYQAAARMSFRLGGGRDGTVSRDYVSGGFAAISEAGAVDVSVRQDLTGAARATTVVASLRAFVPQP